jgi:glucokinase
MNKVIGLDIGGTKISGIVFDGKEIAQELVIVTPKNLKDFKRSLEKLVAFLSAGKHIDGLGVGIAGIVNVRGSMTYSPNMKFLDGFNIGKFFKDMNFKHVRIDNDANFFALAEAHMGKGKGLKNFIGITLGTGIGGGMIIRKKLYRGSHSSAGEAGHIMADFKYDSEHYFQIARNKKDYKKMGEVLGILFANIYNLVDVEAIVLGGTVAMAASKKFLPYALKTAKKHMVNKKIVPKILISNLKNSGAIGAAALLKE